jgi:hypothetical protein
MELLHVDGLEPEISQAPFGAFHHPVRREGIIGSYTPGGRARSNPIAEGGVYEIDPLLDGPVESAKRSGSSAPSHMLLPIPQAP